MKSFVLALLLSIGSAMDFKIVEDNMEFAIDKRAHLGVSFGLYYTAYTLCNCEMTAAMLLASCVGLGYEIYQGFYYERHWGFSKEDMVYNVMGVVAANIVHRTFLWGREFVNF
tara:strand:- start:51 stop:389 length:339 start_codon:yes stop_codon:yes gene_type:complete